MSSEQSIPWWSQFIPLIHSICEILSLPPLSLSFSSLFHYVVSILNVLHSYLFTLFIFPSCVNKSLEYSITLLFSFSFILPFFHSSLHLFLSFFIFLSTFFSLWSTNLPYVMKRTVTIVMLILFMNHAPQWLHCLEYSGAVDIYLQSIWSFRFHSIILPFFSFPHHLFHLFITHYSPSWSLPPSLSLLLFDPAQSALRVVVIRG